MGPALCLPLQMTKEDHLTLLRTARGRDAGAALSYARSMTDDDSRFNEAPGDAETAVGFWHAGAALVNASELFTWLMLAWLCFAELLVKPSFALVISDCICNRFSRRI